MAKDIYLGTALELAIGKPVQLIREGEWDHPEYGKFSVSEADIDNMVKNFEAKVTKQDTPIDIDHDHTRGAVGWLQRVFKSTDDAGRAILRGIVDWTEDGIRDVGTAFKHTSIHYEPDYQDAETGESFGPTLRSASITNFPFVKDMEPISLSEFKTYTLPKEVLVDKKEDKLELSEEEATQVKGILPRLLAVFRDPDPKPEPEPEPAEPVVAKLTEAHQAETKKLREETDAMAKELSELKLARQTDRYIELMEKGRWVGDREQSIGLMRVLAEAKGEDSPEFKAYVAEQDAHSTQIFASGLFKEAGTSAPAVTQDEKMTAEIAEIKAELALTGPSASSLALTEYYRRHPALYVAAQKLAEQRKA
jgi:hypothetical protein